MPDFSRSAPPVVVGAAAANLGAGDYGHLDGLAYRRVLFLIGPTGAFCREDRCQSYFSPELVPSMRPPMEECESAGAVRAAGAAPYLIDAPAEGLDKATTEWRVAELRPDLVVLIATFGTLDADLDWASRLRRMLPEVAVGVRGAPCYTMAEEILAHRDIDFCVRGEYEPAFDDIVRLGYRGARGVVFRDGETISTAHPSAFVEDLDSLPLPDRSVLRRELYKVRGLGFPQATVRVQRGCPYPCTYCLVHTVSGARARHRSPESVADEMAALKADGYSWFYLRAETFSLDRHWTLETCRAIERRCPDVHWVTTTRAECVDREVLTAMRRAGCYGLSFGIDIGSDAIAAKVRKPVAAEEGEAAMRLCDEVGILSLAYVMIGFAWETPETLAETARLVRRLRADLLTVHFAYPYPGTVYYDETRDLRFEVESERAQAEVALSLPGVSVAALKEASSTMLREHYRRPRVLLSLARKMPGLGWRALRPRRREKAATLASAGVTQR